MDLSAPYSALLTDSVGSLLTTLAGTTRPLSGRELARLSGCPHSTTKAALKRFVAHGLVDVQKAGAGAALLHTLNRKHVATDAILILTSLRHQFIDQLRSEIDAWRIAPLHASLYGSAARGDGDTDSDIDVFLVRPADVVDEDLDWRRQVERLPDLILEVEIVRDAVVLSGVGVDDLLMRTMRRDREVAHAHRFASLQTPAPGW